MDILCGSLKSNPFISWFVDSAGVGVRAAQSDFVPGSAFSTPKICLLDKKQARRVSYPTYSSKSFAMDTDAWPSAKLCIAASQSEIYRFGTNPDQGL